MAEYSAKQLDNFQKAATSLKLFSRAELSDDKNRSLIEKLYVDPLPNDQVFKTLLADSTTIIIGRKGSGKSTIFQRVQHEVRKNKSNIISAYMDIRNVYESSQIDPIAEEKIDALESVLSAEQTQRFLLYKRFFRTLIKDIKKELQSQVEQNFLTRLKERVTGTSSEVFSGLDKVIRNLENPDYESITDLIKVERKTANGDKNRNLIKGDFALKASSTDVEVSASAAGESERENEKSTEEAYTQILMRVVGVNDIIEELQKILSAIGIRNLYIFLDDFSELPHEAMKQLVDALISPLSRWSDFIKFKIAAYPGRVYIGSLDKTKIEEVYLDMYGLYGGAGVAKMEEKATDFVRRIIEKRIQHYCKCEADMYFGTKPSDTWRTLFYATMANPRILGHIMLYAHESHLIYNSRIGLQSVQDAAQKYYEEKVYPFFSIGKYKTTFDERSSIYSLKELLEEIVNKARTLRQEGSRDSTSQKSRSHSSHFYISTEYEDLLQSLELSFFITKYFEQSDRAGSRVSIYALNYGLCIKYQIGFGRPTERREDRLYFVDRAFDYNGVARTYMLNNQEIKCDNCNAEFDLSMLDALKMFQMKCPTCSNGKCKVINLSRKYEDIIDNIKPELLLPDAELGILQTLQLEQRTMVAAEIASELDCSGQLVGRRAKNLAERMLVKRENNGAVYKYEITDQAKRAYFSEPERDQLNLSSR